MHRCMSPWSVRSMHIGSRYRMWGEGFGLYKPVIRCRSGQQLSASLFLPESRALGPELSCLSPSDCFLTAKCSVARNVLNTIKTAELEEVVCSFSLVWLFLLPKNLSRVSLNLRACPSHSSHSIISSSFLDTNHAHKGYVLVWGLMNL